jgi:hypothetical protein
MPRFDLKSAQRIARTVKRIEQQSFGGELPGPLAPPRDQRVWWPFRNDSGETAPAGGVLAVTGLTIVSGVALLTVTKPSSTFRRRYAINDALEVANGKYGACCLAGVVQALYDSGTPAEGEGWGPKPSQWSLAKGYPRVADVLGQVDASQKWLLAELEPLTTLIGRIESNLNKGSSGTVYVMDDTETKISSWTVSAVNRYADLTASGGSPAKVQCSFVNNRWCLDSAECL